MRDRVDRDWDALRAWQSRDKSLDEIAAAVVRLWDDRAWTLRGYESWADAFAKEVGKPLRLDASDREHLHRLLTAAGMSSRAIAVVTGTTNKTVGADLSTEENSSVDRTPVPTTGLDGRRRVTDPEASAALTANILALRESDQGLTWPAIGEAVGLTASAAHNRYSAYRRKHPRPGPPAVTELPTPARIAALADTGMSSRQIATEIGISAERVREVARRDAIVIAGDVHRGKGGAKTLDQRDAISRWVTQLAAAIDAADAFIDAEEFTPHEAAEWACQMDEVIRRLRGLTRAFRNQSHQERQTHHG